MEPLHKPLHTTTLNERVQAKAGTFFAAFFLVGLFNNNGYTLVQSAASDLATDFG